MQTLNIGKVCQVRVRSRKTLVSSKDGEIILKSMSETKGDCLILSRSDFDLNRMCLLLLFLFRTNGKKGQLDEKDFHHCYGIFFPRGHSESYLITAMFEVPSQQLRYTLTTAF